MKTLIGLDARIGILGTVSAGSPTPNWEEPELTTASWLLGGDLCLKVVGDSMKFAGIDDGDYVVVRKQAPVPGDIVVACVDDEITCKYWSIVDDGILLAPANPKYKAKVYPLEMVDCQGVVVSTVRRRRVHILDADGERVREVKLEDPAVTYAEEFNQRQADGTNFRAIIPLDE